jgi:hypothetical protein
LGGVQLNADGTFASLEVGPVPVSGPIVAAPDETGAGDLVVLLDGDIPDWVTEQVLEDWGWSVGGELPTSLTGFPFQADVLLLAMNWSGSLDGWSSTLWFDAGVAPMQRLELRLSPYEESAISVRVLETGTDQHGVGYAVVYAQDRSEVDHANVTAAGWRREPWVRIRRQSWSDLADMSEAIEARVVPFRGQALVRDVIIHDANLINSQVFELLPGDVRDALESALTAPVE